MLRRLLSGETDPLQFVSVLVALVIGVTVHEFAHAKRATMAGDPTPGLAGRVTLNPLAHLDLIGSIMILFVGFGWGKPVPVNPAFFKRPRQDDILVAIWGPISNVITAALFALPLHFHLGAAAGREDLLRTIVSINLMLAYFNLLPIFPLDGSHVVSGLLSYTRARAYEDFMHRYGILLLIGFLMALSYIPIFGFIYEYPLAWARHFLTGY
jgi:Zn-dependent protease